ncbi:AMP-dependent synthetase/ligase [Actinophytocola algeriensis]|uniref:Acyl-CoA synthetase n=1 Tax=Actinophytocola algeriensis TaxID=1768010 RepID=A0A7W7VFW5_9PSEU|nr:AMP-dependent synthetase/ligase [Actinophytocola algeriensis]MBB4908817.1 long-chain acyl-CoA synthetase [Actinophytocola algeriensis]MBE1474796.1 long-chain acyl-CoA synthetase [Actinophytocola algeriensis]
MTIEEDCARAVDGLTIPVLLHRNATEFGTLPALTTVDGPEAVTLTWAQLHAEVAAVTCGLDKLGLRPGDRMLIMMSARTEHWIVDLAAVHLGAVPCTAYQTLSPDQLRYLGRHSKAPVIVLEGAEELARWRPILDDLPDLRTVLVLDEDTVPDGDSRFHRLSDVVAAGRAAYETSRQAFTDLWHAVSSGQPVTLLYTSGTTGDPKGVLLSHSNVIYQAAALEAMVPTPAHAPSVSYLPLAHIAERVLGIYVPVFRAGHVHICADASRLVAALCRVRPASFFGVPRVWEKMVAALQAITALLPDDQRVAFERAHALTLDAYRSRARGLPVDEGLAAEVAELDQSVLQPVRAMLGLDELIWPGSGAAPIPVDTLYYLAGVGIEVLEVWGMTETTGTATINTPRRFRPGTVGLPHVGMRVKLADDGEILVGGPLVCLGYLQPDGTVTDQVDVDGLLATGDVGSLDADGFLTITDRKKELIITSSGKNISPARIEGMLRTHPLVGHAAAIGDRRPYVTALIALDEEAAPAWARARGISTDDLAALAGHPAVLAELHKVVTAANERLARAEQVKKYRVLGQPWTPESGELTPTLKLRRRVIAERCADLIDDLYRTEVTANSV